MQNSVAIRRRGDPTIESNDVRLRRSRPAGARPSVYATVTRPPGTVPRQNVGESIGKCFPHSFPRSRGDWVTRTRPVRGVYAYNRQPAAGTAGIFIYRRSYLALRTSWTNTGGTPPPLLMHENMTTLTGGGSREIRLRDEGTRCIFPRTLIATPARRSADRRHSLATMYRIHDQLRRFREYDRTEASRDF